MRLSVACPAGYEPDQAMVWRARELGGEVIVTQDLAVAAPRADVLYTDVWVSMGDEKEEHERLRDFDGF